MHAIQHNVEISLTVRDGFVLLFHRKMFVRSQQCYSRFLGAEYNRTMGTSLYSYFLRPRLFFNKIQSSTCLPPKVIFIRASFKQSTTKPSLWLQHDLQHDRLRRRMLPTVSKNLTTRTFIVETVVQEAFRMSQTRAIGTEHYKPYCTFPNL
jgi:hypothetical protein